MQASTKSKVWDFLSQPLKDEVVATGPHRGKRKMLFLCKVRQGDGFCGCELMLTSASANKMPPTSPNNFIFFQSRL